MKKASGATALAAFALTSAPLAHSSPLIIDQQRIDQTQAAHTDALRGLSTENSASPSITAPAGPSPPPPGGRLIAMTRVHITGSSLPTRVLDEAWRRQIGDALDDATITAVSNALTVAYEHSDIALYSIVTPDQDFAGGVLEIRVLEGHVGNIVIQTDDAAAPDIRLARRYAGRLTHETPLRRSTLERMMSLIREIPGERVQPALSAASEVGAAVLTLTMRRKPIDVGLSVSNRGTPLLGRTQASLDASFNGMIRGGDHVDVAVTAPIGQNSFRFAALAYSTPVGADGTTVSASISNLHTEPHGIGVRGEATAGGISVSYPLLRGFTRSFYGSVGIDSLDTENATVGQLVDTSRTRALRAGVSYTEANATTARNASLFASFGIDGLGARVNPLFADADFTKLAVQAGWSHTYWQRLALRLNAQAQVSESMLPASEQFALGGDAYGRAFPSAIIQGDQGAAASVEAAFLTPAEWLPSMLRGSEAYVFFDAGEVHANARPLLPGSDDSLSSAGFGARIALGRRLVLGAELAHAVDTPRSDNADDWRFVYTIIGRD